ncbi:Glutamate-1-semialdehyde 2,1-aminomutase [compost metagenome]
MNATTASFVSDIRNYIEEKKYEVKIFTIASIFWFAFTDQDAILKASEIDPNSMDFYKKMHRELLNRGIYFGPSGYEVGFISHAHTDADLATAKQHIFAALDLVFG